MEFPEFEAYVDDSKVVHDISPFLNLTQDGTVHRRKPYRPTLQEAMKLPEFETYKGITFSDKGGKQIIYLCVKPFNSIKMLPWLIKVESTIDQFVESDEDADGQLIDCASQTEPLINNYGKDCRCKRIVADGDAKDALRKNRKDPKKKASLIDRRKTRKRSKRAGKQISQ